MQIALGEFEVQLLQLTWSDVCCAKIQVLTQALKKEKGDGHHN
jgi:hypothetical protein